MQYHCEKCDMSVKGLTCGKCDCALEHGSINHEGQDIGVSKCGTCEGMIKSPQCCGQDMGVQ